MSSQHNSNLVSQLEVQSNSTVLSWRARLGFFLLTIFAAFIWNWQFLLHTSDAAMRGRNDVASIWAGYKLSSNLWSDGLAWWHGPWIQQGIVAFRPLSAYLYWFDCWLGESFGWVWVGWLGFLLFIAALLSAAWLAWRWTRNLPCVTVAILLGTSVRFWNPGQEDMWLIWFPIHQELLVAALFLALLASFDWWLETRGKISLLLTWVLFLAGLAAKEYIIIFPLIAVALSFRPDTFAPRRALFLAGAMLLVAAAFMVFRAHVLGAGARNPTLQPIQFLRKPIIFCYPEVGRYLLTGAAWLPCFAAWWFLCGAAWLRARQDAARREWKNSSPAARWMLNSVGGFALVIVAAIWSISALWQIPVTETVMIFLDGTRAGSLRRWDAGLIIFDCYTLWLVWKYRRDEMSLVAWLCWVLSYGPVLDYIGWHYTLGPLLLKGVYLAVLAKVLWRDLSATDLAKRWPRRALRPAKNKVANAV